jgi:hypothetical protein
MGVAFLLSPLFPINSRSDSSRKLAVIYPKSLNQNQGGEEEAKKKMMHANLKLHERRRGACVCDH